MKSQTRRIAYFITVPIMVVILVAVGLFIGLSIKPPKQITFADNPATAAVVPQFSTTVAATKDTPKVSTAAPGNAAVSVSNGTSRVAIPTKTGSCSVVLQTNFAQAFTVNQGQEYLSKNAMYNQAQGGGTVLKGESTTLIPSNKGDVIFSTGHFTSSGVTTYVASRAFAKIYPNGLSKTTAPNLKTQFGYSPYKGVAILNITYSCQTGSTATGSTSSAEFQQILKAVSVTL